MNKIRYGVIGIGKQGSGYARKLLAGKDKNAVLAAVCDVDPSRRKWAEENLGGVKIFDTVEALLSSGNVDAVVIDTPHYAHPAIARNALERNIHVLCDKPAGVFTKAVREVAEWANIDRPNLQFGLLYNQRTNGVYLKAKELIDAGRLGKLKRIVWIITNWYRPQAYYNQGGWRGTWAGEGGGVLINQDPHQLDLFTWLAGVPIKRVWSVASTVNRDIDVENDVTACCEFDGGATGVFITSTHDAPGTNRLELSGEGGKIVIEGNSDISMKLTFIENAVPESKFSRENTAFMGKISHKKSTYRLPLREVVRMAAEGQHIQVIRAFSKAVRGEGEPIARYSEGLRGLGFSNAVHMSAWTGKEVSFPFDEDEYLALLNKRIERETHAKEKV